MGGPRTRRRATKGSKGPQQKNGIGNSSAKPSQPLVETNENVRNNMSNNPISCDGLVGDYTGESTTRDREFSCDFFPFIQDENNAPSVESIVVKASEMQIALNKTQEELARVQDDLKQSQAAVASSAQLSALEAHAKELEAKMEALCAKNDDIRAQRDAARAENAQVVSRLDAALEALDRKETELSRHKETHKEEMMRLQAMIAHREKRLVAVQAETEEHIKAAGAEAEASEEAMKTQLKSLQENFDKVKSRIEGSKAAVKAADIRTSRMEQEIVGLKKTLVEKDEALKHADEVALDLENQLSVAENELRELRQWKHEELVPMQQRLASLESDLQESTMTIESRDWRIEDLVAQLEDLRDALKNAETEGEAARQQAVAATSALEASRQQLGELAALRTTDIEEGLKTLRGLEEEVGALKAAAAKKELVTRAALAEVAVLRRQAAAVATVATVATDGEEVQNEEVEVSSSCDATVSLALAEETASVRQRCDRLQASLAHAKTNAAANKAGLQELERRLVEAEERIASTEAERNQAVATATALVSRVEAGDAEIASLRSNLSTAMQSSLGLRQSFGRVAELEARVEELEQEVGGLTSDLEAREWRIEDLSTQVEELRDALREANSEYEAMEESHARELDEQRKALKAQRGAAVQRVVVEKNDEITRLKEQHGKEIQCVGEEWGQKVEESEKKLKQVEKGVARLEEERTALLSMVEELQGAMKRQEGKYEEAVAKLKETRTVLGVKNGELAAAKGKIKATEELIETLAAMKTTKKKDSGNGGGEEVMVQYKYMDGKENDGVGMQKKNKGGGGKAATTTVVVSPRGKGPLEFAAVVAAATINALDGTSVERNGPLRPLSANAM